MHGDRAVKLLEDRVSRLPFTQTSFVLGGCELGSDGKSPKALDLVGLCTLLVSETALVHYTPRPKGMAASPIPVPTGKEAIDEKCLGPDV